MMSARVTASSIPLVLPVGAAVSEFQTRSRRQVASG